MKVSVETINVTDDAKLALEHREGKGLKHREIKTILDQWLREQIAKLGDEGNHIRQQLADQKTEERLEKLRAKDAELDRMKKELAAEMKALGAEADAF